MSAQPVGSSIDSSDSLYARHEGHERRLVRRSFLKSVLGAAGSNAKAVLKTRMQGGDPPDSFQVHMGHELTDGYVAANQVEPLNDLYKSEGFETAFPKGVLEIVQANGNYWSVPVNIHRAN